MKLSEFSIKTILCSTLIAFCGLCTAGAQVRPIVSNLNAFPQSKNQIRLEWTVPEISEPSVTGIVIVRDSQVISSYDQINSKTIIASVSSGETSYIDTIPDSKDYFYCVLARVSESKIYKIILPSINTTITGTKAKSSAQEGIVVSEKSPKVEVIKFIDPSERLRQVPLPRPDLIENNDTKKIQLGNAAVKAVKELGLKDIKPDVITKEFVFEEDMISPAGGDEYFLFKILKESFVKKQYSASVKSLTEFLSVHRDEKTTKRSYFYLGEAFYFTRDYQNALFCFLKVQEDYPELAKKWIDSCLDLIQLPDHS